MMWMLLVSCLLLRQTLADISGTTPYPQACVCATTTGVNVRNSGRQSDTNPHSEVW